MKRVYDRLLKRVLYRGALHCMRSRGIAGYIKEWLIVWLSNGYNKHIRLFATSHGTCICPLELPLLVIYHVFSRLACANLCFVSANWSSSKSRTRI